MFRSSFRVVRTTLALLLALTAPLAAQDTALRRLDTGDDGRGWEAVGRLDIDGKGFCTGALIAEDLVLTAAHCLFDLRTGKTFDLDRMEFLAGWRNGRASAYRKIRNAVVPPDYDTTSKITPNRVRSDFALLQLYQPIRNTTVIPFDTDLSPRTGAHIAIVSYAHNRSEAPALQETCNVLAKQEGALVMSCQVDFGSSGAPVFGFGPDGTPRIVSVVSAKAEVSGRNVSLGTDLGQLNFMRAELAQGRGRELPPVLGNETATTLVSEPPKMTRVTSGSRFPSGAKSVRPGQ
ncbi:trypsin-like serine peptidase [Pseudooceanicola sp. C21-150M6]|uniref:trypsin-like serine peptidase n=1 Tax=Pseudooceanicola sp. C21-150M6 TaxID=3434355 RepID=UPI003D7FA73F